MRQPLLTIRPLLVLLAMSCAGAYLLPAESFADEATATATDEKIEEKTEEKSKEKSEEDGAKKSDETAASDEKSVARDSNEDSSKEKSGAEAKSEESSSETPAESGTDEDAKAKENEGSGDDSKGDSDAKKAKERLQAVAKEIAKLDGKKTKEAVAAAVKGSKAKRSKVRFALMTVNSSLSESAGQIGPFGQPQLDLREFVGRLDRASKDKTIGGVVLDIQDASLGRGKIEELRGAIARFRESGKKVYAQLESAMPADYLIACACDEIVMPETGMVTLPGVYAEATFYKGLLDKIGVEADFIHIGDCKGAAEPMTREEFSEPVRKNMTAMIDGLYDDMVTTIVKSRPLSIAQAKEVIDRGLLTATEAKRLGLIDRVAYPDALRDELEESHDAEPLVYVKNYGQKKVETDFSGPMGFFKLMQAMMGNDSGTRKARGKKIAVVYAIGPIMTGKSQSDLFGDSTLGSTTIVEALREANEDDDVAAIVLRVDSPGGSALASDLIWHETQVIEKPIVASMGDVAASGGYYISMGADKIIAAPGTVTGSIGVVGGKLAVRGIYDKLGITTETIERGKNSGLFASSDKFTAGQKKVVEEMMRDIYRQFTTKAAEGRNMSLEKLEALAGGQVYTGRQAKENGLIDELGTLHDAIREAKKLAGIGEEESVRIETLPEATNFFESLFGDLDAEQEVRLNVGIDGLDQLAPEVLEIARRANRLRGVFDQPAALVMPFELEIH